MYNKPESQKFKSTTISKKKAFHLSVVVLLFMVDPA